MKPSKFAIIAFVMSLLVFIQALVVFTNLSETNPLAAILFPLIVLISLPEFLLGPTIQRLGFPIIMPVLAIIFAVISLYKVENKKIFSILSIVLVLLSITLYIALPS